MSVVPVQATPTINGRPDIALIDALKKISPQAREKAKASAQDFEQVFLNSMFQQMFADVKGEGPLGSTEGTGPWRSMLTDEYAKGISKSGGIGITDDVFRTLIMQQAGAT
ncbi:flagellar assembly peptidoglycan hydrolase FlgJ [Bradyrhizobium sp. LHD-71]|uniref:flagellar assembly peptidoglycan hydrolase FlgJ n=1 Tax=Bradyrhizobium sp. LHD-71 TaxID=3072141 RepID=UPI00280F9764|nr:flagellar assembly peptidoglycan hydrolase FlgJ [Bradyrhizobium sp. LHD-71]MDQ8732601.1 flagellar assembly peptidoglycan hydrolase FlgJ [Bradyrhizobium sp. LHD-71]